MELLGQFLQLILGMISEFVGKFNLRRMSKGLYIPRCPNYAEETAAPAPRTTSA
jgi:hypothetical protein